MTVEDYVSMLNEGAPAIPYELDGNLIKQGQRIAFYVARETLRDPDTGEELIRHDGHRAREIVLPGKLTELDEIDIEFG